MSFKTYLLNIIRDDRSEAAQVAQGGCILIAAVEIALGIVLVHNGPRLAALPQGYLRLMSSMGCYGVVAWTLLICGSTKLYAVLTRLTLRARLYSSILGWLFLTWYGAAELAAMLNFHRLINGPSWILWLYLIISAWTNMIQLLAGSKREAELAGEAPCPS